MRSAMKSGAGGAATCRHDGRDEPPRQPHGSYRVRVLNPLGAVPFSRPAACGADETPPAGALSRALPRRTRRGNLPDLVSLSQEQRCRKGAGGAPIAPHRRLTSPVPRGGGFGANRRRRHPPTLGRWMPTAGRRGTELAYRALTRREAAIGLVEKTRGTRSVGVRVGQQAEFEFTADESIPVRGARAACAARRWRQCGYSIPCRFHRRGSWTLGARVDSREGAPGPAGGGVRGR